MPVGTFGCMHWFGILVLAVSSVYIVCSKPPEERSFKVGGESETVIPLLTSAAAALWRPSPVGGEGSVMAGVQEGVNRGGMLLWWGTAAAAVAEGVGCGRGLSSMGGILFPHSFRIVDRTVAPITTPAVCTAPGPVSVTARRNARLRAAPDARGHPGPSWSLGLGCHVSAYAPERPHGSQ